MPIDDKLVMYTYFNTTFRQKAEAPVLLHFANYIYASRNGARANLLPIGPKSRLLAVLAANGYFPFQTRPY